MDIFLFWHVVEKQWFVWLYAWRNPESFVKEFSDKFDSNISKNDEYIEVAINFMGVN